MHHNQFEIKGDNVAKQVEGNHLAEAFKELFSDLNELNQGKIITQRTRTMAANQELRELTHDLVNKGVLPGVSLDGNPRHHLNVVGLTGGKNGLVLEGEVVDKSGRKHEELFVMGADGKFRQGEFHTEGGKRFVEAKSNAPELTAKQVDASIEQDRNPVKEAPPIRG